MNCRRALVLVTAAAAVLAACGDGDTKESADPTVADVSTTEAEGASTTIEDTTPTSAATDYSYEVVYDASIERDEIGEYTVPIPADRYPMEARNPAHPDAMSLGELVALPANSTVCLHNGLRNDDGTVTDAPIVVLETGLHGYTTEAGDNGAFVGVRYQLPGELIWWVDASNLGVIPKPDGLTWDPDQWITSGDCPAS